jgi:hypothetical protein
LWRFCGRKLGAAVEGDEPQGFFPSTLLRTGSPFGRQNDHVEVGRQNDPFLPVVRFMASEGHGFWSMALPWVVLLGERALV